MKSILSLLFSFFLVFNLFGQNIEPAIKEIRTQFAWINSQKDFKKAYFENLEFTDDVPSEGCGLDAYYKNGNIYKIIESDAVSAAVYTTEYYLKNNKLIFVYKTEKTFIPSADESENIKIKLNYEERVYYKNGKIIRHLEKGVPLTNTKTDYQKLYNEYRKYILTKINFEKQYNLLQGSWLNTNNADDFFDIEGLIYITYNEEDIPVFSRFYLDGKFLNIHNTETGKNSKFKISELSDKKLVLQNQDSKNVVIFEKNID